MMTYPFDQDPSVPSPINDLIDARVQEALKKYNVGLDQLPLAALQRKLESDWNPDADLLATPHSVGTDSLAQVPAARIHKTGAAQTDTGAGLIITFETVDYDTASMTRSANTRLVAPVTGIYSCAGCLGWAFDAAGGFRQAWLTHSSGIVIDANRVGAATTSGATRLPLACEYAFKRGEYVFMSANMGGPATLATEGPSDMFHMSMTFLSNYYTPESP